MRKETLPARKSFAPSFLSQLLNDMFGGWGKTEEAPVLPMAARKAPRRQGFTLEPIEPRLLLSADLSYPNLANALDVAVTNLTLKAESDSGDLYLRLYETGTSNLVSEVLLDDAGDVNVNISRAIGAGLFADSVHVDLTTFDLLDTFVNAHGGKLTLNFTGDSNVAFKDSLIFDGAETIAYDLSVQSDSDITVSSSVNLVAGDISLSVSDSDSGLPPIGDEFFADAEATIDVLGSLSGGDIKLSATSTINVDNNSLGLGGLQLAFIYADSDAEINIGSNSQITASGKLDVLATSNVSGLADMASLNSKTDASTDAAVASVVITSHATTSVAGSANLSVNGAFTLSAKNVSIANAIADGSKGGAGATLGVGVISSGAEASIKGNASVQAGSIAINAESQNDLTALAKSTTSGATSSSTQQDSQKALADNDAKSSDGSIGLAGAVAVGTVVSSTEAYIDSSALITSNTSLDILAKSVTNSQTRADGSATVADASADSGSGNVGIAVGVGAGNLTNTARAGGTGTITAGSLNVRALMASEDRTLTFNGDAVDDAKDTVDLSGGAHGLKTGDALVYHQGSAAITGLSDGATYYAAVQDDGKIKLSTHADGSSPFAIGDPGASATGFSFTFAQNVSRLGVVAIAGASGGSTSVAGALALNIGISEASATVASNSNVVITGGGNVTVMTENYVENVAKATGKQSGGANLGVGPTFTLNIGQTDTDALIQNGAIISGADDITLSALSKNLMDATADGAAKGKTAVTPVIAISVANNTTNANLGTLGGTTSLTGDLSVTATHEGSVSTVAEGATESGETGVGISLALTVATDFAAATTSRDLAAGGAIAFNARTVSANKSRAKASVAGGDKDDKPADGSQDADKGGVNQKVDKQKSFADGKWTGKGGKADGDPSGASAEGTGGWGGSQKGKGVREGGLTVVSNT